MDEGVDGADDTVCPLRFVAGEVGQLPEDDIDPDSADEPHHHRVRHEPQDRTEPQKPGRQHHNAGQHRQGEQCPRRVITGVNRRDISDDDSHGPGGLDSHEGRAGDKRATDRAEQVCVKARKRADPGEQASGEAVGNALHAEHQPGDGVLAQRVTPDREAESHAQVLRVAAGVTAWTIASPPSRHTNRSPASAKPIPGDLPSPQTGNPGRPFLAHEPSAYRDSD